jgi:hypothetical protein
MRPTVVITALTALAAATTIPSARCLRLRTTVGLPCYPRHGCAPRAALAIVTWSVSELWHLVHRKRRFFSGTSPRPLSIIAWRSAGA